jgi:hypothetical protein
VEKVGKKCGLLLLFSKKLPKVKNHQMGENSPNLVTLLGKCSRSAKIRRAVGTHLKKKNDNLHFSSQKVSHIFIVCANLMMLVQCDQSRVKSRPKSRPMSPKSRPKSRQMSPNVAKCRQMSPNVAQCRTKVDQKLTEKVDQKN